MNQLKLGVEPFLYDPLKNQEPISSYHQLLQDSSSSSSNTCLRPELYSLRYICCYSRKVLAFSYSMEIEYCSYNLHPLTSFYRGGFALLFFFIPKYGPTQDPNYKSYFGPHHLSTIKKFQIFSFIWYFYQIPFMCNKFN